MIQVKPLVIGDLVAKVPLIQGGMGVGVSLSSLAGAVAAEGGIGVISTAQIGYREPDFDTDPIGANLRAIKTEIQKARRIAKEGILGVNIMVATRRYEDYVKAAVEAGIDLIISGAGLPMDLPKLVGAAKTKLAPIVSSVKSVQVIMRYWWKKYSRLPDAVVIEGPLAGGHLGFHKEQLEDIEGLHYDDEVKAIIEQVGATAAEHETEIPVIMAGVCTHVTIWSTIWKWAPPAYRWQHVLSRLMNVMRTMPTNRLILMRKKKILSSCRVLWVCPEELS